MSIDIPSDGMACKRNAVLDGIREGCKIVQDERRFEEEKRRRTYHLT
jgi:hypothetical protein